MSEPTRFGSKNSGGAVNNRPASAFLPATIIKRAAEVFATISTLFSVSLILSTRKRRSLGAANTAVEIALALVNLAFGLSLKGPRSSQI